MDMEEQFNHPMVLVMVVEEMNTRPKEPTLA
jgi:hypothetical protein